MRWAYGGAVAMVLLAGAISPALAACVSQACPDAALIERTRLTLQQTCGCMQAGQSHRAYMKCVRKVLDTTKEPAMLLDRPCRNAVVRCENKSICGEPDAVVCCKVRKLGTIVASMRKPAGQCKKGIACGAALGRYSTFDACSPTGGCAAGVTVTTTTSTTTSTVPPPPLTPLENCQASRDAFEATLPVPTPLPGRYVVQLVNETDVVMLAAANAAHQVGQPPFPVVPREGTWVIQPKGVLTIDIPPEWEHTIGSGAQGPVFWTRTGCRYDIEHDLAQCETGGCGVAYDCSQANRTPPGPKALAEWTFNDDNHNAAPDVSVVDGVNLNMDIAPLGPRTVRNPNFSHWLDHPLVNCGGDQRDVLWCPPAFRLTRSELAMFVQGSPGGDEIVGCFTNCGRYKYPLEPDLNCNPDPATDPRCYYWKSFCCAFPTNLPSPYDNPCTSNAQCTQNGICWNNGQRMVCACGAFNLLPDCPDTQCTFPYTAQTPANQPPFRLCSDVTNATGNPSACVGDDTFHYVMPYGLTWPNDPQTFFNDAHAYRIVFAPGGTSVPVTPAGPIPNCKDLPASYGYTQAFNNCSGTPTKVFGGAYPTPTNWDCSIANGGVTNGLLCRW